MEYLERILDKCTDKDRKIIEAHELYVHEAVDELVKAFDEFVSEYASGSECPSGDNVCLEELEFFVPTDTYKKVAYVLYLLGLSLRCAKSLAYAYLADMLQHAEDVEVEE